MSRKPKRKKKHPGSAGGSPSRPAAAKGSKNNSTALLVWASVIVAVAFGIYYLSGASANKARDAPSLGNRHIRVGTSNIITYNTDPPTSGPHYPTIVRWGIHERPIDKGFQAHNLEDGGVLVQYNCSDCPELVKKLEKPRAWLPEARRPRPLPGHEAQNRAHRLGQDRHLRGF